MEIFKDTFVIIEYSVKTEDGTFVKGENGPISLNFIAGYDQLLPALEQRLLGLEEGDEVDFVIPARFAFGVYDPSKVRTRSLADYPEGRSLQPGKWVVASNESAKVAYTFFVKEKTDTEVTLDYNNPLAGKDLYYQVKVVKVRPALHEELEYLRPCEFQKQPGQVAAS